MDPKMFFLSPKNVAHKQYESLRALYTGQSSAQEVAKRYGYTLNSFYSLTRDFKKNLSHKDKAELFFIKRKVGRKPQDTTGQINRLIVALRKKYLSIPDIKVVLDVQGHQVSERYM